MTACASPTAPEDGGRVDGGVYLNPWLDCGDGGRFYCTAGGEPLRWGTNEMGWCSTLNQHPDMTMRIIATEDGDGGYIPSCPDGYAFYCETREVCAP